MFIYDNHKGSALLLSLITGVIIITFAGSICYMSSQEQNLVFQEHHKLTSYYIAEAGQSRALQYINLMLSNNQVTFTQVDQNLSNRTLYDNEPFLAPCNGKLYTIGYYTVIVKILTSSDITTTEDISGDKVSSVRYVTIESTGKVVGPNNSTFPTISRTTYKIKNDVSRVFDYCYFINNWGWFHSNNITTYGNARSNGSFSMGKYRPTIWGKPRFESSEGIDLIGYIDDNQDGQLNNQDGGIYSWNNITGTPSANGRPSDLYAGLQGESTQYDLEQLPMPNLNDLSIYEKKAKDEQSSIKIGTTTICDGIWGDNEVKQNLYLEGTYENPIQLNGTVVVRGDVIIRGYVTGQGTIYSGRNVYIPQRILYRNPPTERRPSNNSESARENWRETNLGTDMLGLFAKENIVLGDYTSSTWQNNVYSWINDPANESKEDSGADKIPTTYDTGENDNIWTVLRNDDGSAIPGTGEDIDGDGQFDDRTKLSDFYLSTPLASGSTAWGGNIPTGVTSFSQVTYWNDTLNTPSVGTGSQKFPQIDATLYTNHFLGGYINNLNSYSYKSDNLTYFSNDASIQINGAVVARNESIIYEARELIFQHDERLSGSDGSQFNIQLPRVWEPLETVSVEIY